MIPSKKASKFSSNSPNVVHPALVTLKPRADEMIQQLEFCGVDVNQAVPCFIDVAAIV